MIEMVLNKIRVDETRNEQVIILREKDGERYLPVVIGLAEVNAIKMKLGGVEPPRPLTHDLLINAIGHLDARLEEVVIDHLENNTFFAKLKIKRNGQEEVLVDSRPSDAVALALRADAAIFANEKILAEAGVTEI